ncbi:hypothetical protein [Longimicrobium sp.]|uniref:pilus assembly PilX family protein n=1 Tax=Longimicrobium sp. TaxID=2029185 RepID=UPI003B3BE4ED
MTPRILRFAADRRGVALPVALFGLVAVSLLVTTALLTSSTEYAISAAHRTAAGSLYNADAALEQYIFTRAQAGGAFMQATQNGAAAGPDGKNYLLQVARLSWTEDTAPPPGQVAATELFSIVATPQDGRGRGVGAFLRLRRLAARLDTNINAGATSGGDIEITGSSFISDGRSGVNYCGTSDNQADYAVQVTAGSKIDAKDKNLEGVTNVTTYQKSELANNVLGPGVTLRALADQATIQFGPRWNKPAFSGRPSGDATDENYNWGCPAVLGVSCPNTSSQRHVVVAIDANGGEVKINGDYGQGMIVIINGSMSIQGNFVYKGIILVEKDMNIRGGSGGQESKIEGAVVSFGQNSMIEDNLSGNATIKYNFCAIEDAERAMNQNALQNAPQSRLGGTFAWYELIR